MDRLPGTVAAGFLFLGGLLLAFSNGYQDWLNLLGVLVTLGGFFPLAMEAAAYYRTYLSDSRAENDHKGEPKDD